MSLLDELNYCHDGVLRELTYAPSGTGSKRLALLVECAEDAGAAAWNGTTVRIDFEDVFFMRHLAWGHTAGDEGVDGFHRGVSADILEELQTSRRQGLHVPDLGLTISFHTGSSIEVVCARVRVERVKAAT